MKVKIPSTFKNDNFWFAAVALIYLFSGMTDTEINWQVVVVVASYIGGTSLKDAIANFLAVAKKIDAVTDQIDKIGEGGPK